MVLAEDHFASFVIKGRPSSLSEHISALLPALFGKEVTILASRGCRGEQIDVRVTTVTSINWIGSTVASTIPVSSMFGCY